MATGTAAPTSTMARRWVPRKTPNAGSIRSRRAGRSCPARARRRVRAWPWTPSTGISSAGKAALIQLLDPPFDHSEPNPGYIKGYLPGVRENGGQYTHAAVWAAMAFAAMGDAERAWELFTMINPVNHGNSADSIAVYKTEPYVLASDVYALPPHTRPRRLDVVHGLGRLDVPAHPGITPGREARRGQAAFCAVPARGLDDRSNCTTGIGRLSTTLRCCKSAPQTARRG